ncbi:hypothetical protein BBBOND_0209620 [Babesia bigemina]|uniref:Uncharacterized protein n=1 Tax=Babesia bigemina TaxID=5866 RepID=A0A061DAB0_BABBI|nr:hypothetical protein BBBOND_0209620 [Babesia bigemina]CDR95809.1 hypothetical protein BBBOND_0209620 [Babesia bigemina]|eukprot:XP_012767995.1 hypothetical protein BBBOND_0209620 [Babesia bigemina]
MRRSKNILKYVFALIGFNRLWDSTCHHKVTDDRLNVVVKFIIVQNRYYVLLNIASSIGSALRRDPYSEVRGIRRYYANSDCKPSTYVNGELPENFVSLKLSIQGKASH